MTDQRELIFTGIDFGTTFSAIGYVTRSASGGLNTPKAIFYLGKNKIPTAVYFQSDISKPPYVGTEAIIRFQEDADKRDQKAFERLFSNFKRELLNTSPIRRLGDGRAPTSSELAVFTFERLREIAEGNLGVLENPVICHPVGTAWDRGIRRIAKASGFDKFSTVTEPLAALYYAHYLHPIFDDRPQTVLLIDFGGGTCDVFLMKVTITFQDGRFQIGPDQIDQAQLTYKLSSGEESSYGGMDVDKLIANYLKAKWRDKYPTLATEFEKLDDAEYQWDFLREAQKAKEYLSTLITTKSTDSSYHVRIRNLPGNTELDYELNADEFTGIVRPDIQAKFTDFFSNPESGFFRRNKTTGQKIDRVILAGGSSNLPWLSEILSTICPRAKMKGQVYQLLEPEMSVAYGAAVYNYYLQVGKLPIPIYLEDTLKISVGGRLYPLARKNTRLPYRSSQFRANHYFRTVEVSDTITVRLYKGEGQSESDCHPLGEEREINFGEKLKVGTLLTFQVQVDLLGNVELTIFPYRQPQKARKCIFEPLNVR